MKSTKIKTPVRVKPNDTRYHWGTWSLVDADGIHLQGFINKQLAHEIADALNERQKMVEENKSLNGTILAYGAQLVECNTNGISSRELCNCGFSKIIDSASASLEQKGGSDG